MNSRQRLLAALNGQMPDRLPVTTHHLMRSYLDRYLDGAPNQEFFDRFGLDSIHWMMPLLERLAAMKPDALETFTPAGMGGDVDLAEARRRLGDTVCMIGGFDQLHYFNACTPAQTRAEVRRCFEAASQDGRFILSPSDHFFDAEPELIAAYADEAGACSYS